MRRSEELIQRWAHAYLDGVRPGLFIGNFRFLEPSTTEWWKAFGMRSSGALWGGEVAANRLTDEYLRPQEYTIYVKEEGRPIIEKLRLVRDAVGPVHIFRKFWDDELDDLLNENQLVPPLIAYADLIATSDSRCKEAAQIILKERLLV